MISKVHNKNNIYPSRNIAPRSKSLLHSQRQKAKEKQKLQKRIVRDLTSSPIVPLLRLWTHQIANFKQQIETLDIESLKQIRIGLQRKIDLKTMHSWLSPEESQTLTKTRIQLLGILELKIQDLKDMEEVLAEFNKGDDLEEIYNDSSLIFETTGEFISDEEFQKIFRLSLIERIQDIYWKISESVVGLIDKVQKFIHSFKQRVGEQPTKKPVPSNLSPGPSPKTGEGSIKQSVKQPIKKEPQLIPKGIPVHAIPNPITAKEPEKPLTPPKRKLRSKEPLSSQATDGGAQTAGTTTKTPNAIQPMPAPIAPPQVKVDETLQPHSGIPPLKPVDTIQPIEEQPLTKEDNTPIPLIPEPPEEANTLSLAENLSPSPSPESGEGRNLNGVKRRGEVTQPTQGIFPNPRDEVENNEKGKANNRNYSIAR